LEVLRSGVIVWIGRVVNSLNFGNAKIRNVAK
jgi:hypothetical protein